MIRQIIYPSKLQHPFQPGTIMSFNNKYTFAVKYIVTRNTYRTTWFTEVKGSVRYTHNSRPQYDWVGCLNKKDKRPERSIVHVNKSWIWTICTKYGSMSSNDIQWYPHGRWSRQWPDDEVRTGPNGSGRTSRPWFDIRLWGSYVRSAPSRGILGKT